MSATGTTMSSSVQFMIRDLRSVAGVCRRHPMQRSPSPPLIGRPMSGASRSRHRATVASAMMMPAMQTSTLPDRPILVVDDDAKIVRLVRTYLERDGYSVVTAADGPAALAAIEEHQPALVVLDLMLPEL